MPKKILIVAGEASGDMHGAELITHLRKTESDLKFFGLGGPLMKTAGAHILRDMTQMAVVGFIEVLKHYSEFKKIFDELVQKTLDEKPDAAILIDYPGFNLRLAQELHKHKIKVIYFISPQVWAWGHNRIKNIKRTVDLMLVLFPFEETLYRDGTFNVKWVGHPLLDVIRPSARSAALLDDIGFDRTKTTIALLPGSREKEITNHLRLMLMAAQKIHQKKPSTQFLICRAPSVGKEIFKRIIDNTKIDYPYKILNNQTHDALSNANAAIVASGTATLETAVLNVPMVIVYKVSFLTGLLARLFIRIPHIGLVNIVAGRKVVPELIQYEATPNSVASVMLSVLNDPQRLARMHTDLSAVKNALGMPGACERAARDIFTFLNQPSAPSATIR